MFLGLFTLEATLIAHIQLADGNAPATADAQPTYRIYAGASGSPIATGTCSTVVDSQTGLHSLTQALTTAAGFARGNYAIRVGYDVSSVAKAQEFSFQIV